MWHRVAQRLRHDFFLVLPDLRGYGDSSHAPGLPDHSNYSKRALAQDLIEVMDTLGIAAFALCGHDRGGRVAHRLALDHPARVTQALRDRHRADAGHVRAHRLRFRARLLPLVPPDPAAPLPELMIGGNPRRTCTPSSAAGAAAGWATSSRARWPSTNAASAAPRPSTPPARTTAPAPASTWTHDRESRARGHKIACDTLVLWGEHGVVQRLFEPLALWQAQCAGAVTGWAMPAGHFIPEQLPDETVMALRAFMD
jgi:haloacetate dehalogenase